MGCSNQKLVKEHELARKEAQPKPPPPPPPPFNPPASSNGIVPAPGQSQPATGAAKMENKNKLTEQQKKEFNDWADATKKEADRLAAQIMAMLSGYTKESVYVTALRGEVNITVPSDAKIVRIFTSSTFTDTKHERNYLMKHSYPQIKNHCRRIGYEFQVVDMRWGVREEAADDHMATELCLKELKLCQQVSTGPNFVSLLSHKYGYTPFPRLIEASEFESLMGGIEEEEILALFNKWYTKDDNAIPAEYVLCPISTHLPGFISHDNEEKKVAKETWWKESDIMQQALEQSAFKVFDEQMARKFVMSVTENEVNHGLLELKNPSDQCLWLKRAIVDIQGQEKNHALARFMECIGPEEKCQKAQSLLRELRDEKMNKALSKDKVLEYNVHWNVDGGINPDSSDEHKTYLEKMSNDFTQQMISMVDKSVKEKSRKDDPVSNECLQHIRFCQMKCKNFHGREETIEKIKDYVMQVNVKKEPLVIHGPSGSGKTSIMAMVAKLASTWLNPKPLVLFRFLGTTQDSSSVVALLHSLTSQIEKVSGMKPSPPTENLDLQKARFWITVHKYKAKKPLVIILDSLDQLDVAYDARQLLWMPSVLAKGTIILSTLEEPQYESFPALQKMITNPSNFISIPTLSRDTSTMILSSWFKMSKRQVNEKQMKMLLDAFEKCSIPLFLKLSFDEAIRWTSYIDEDQMVLRDTVRASIDHLFERLEKLHGKILVSRSLAYLTLAKNGASEAELEDILSCDDDVLNDVYMYWTPPMRRLPPLLLVRIRTDLSQYLVERGADGVRVLYWYHRQFIEAAHTRYCSDLDTLSTIHQNLADFYAGTWTHGKKKPFTNKNGIDLEEDRYMAEQPLEFGEKMYNFRKLNNLPYHCCKSGNLDMMRQQCLANIKFLVTKLAALGFMLVMDDFKMARKRFPDDEFIASILGAMQLSHKGLQMDAGQLVPQMLQRLEMSAHTSAFLQQCREYPRPYMVPNMQLLDLPGGQLVKTIAAHQGDVDMIDLTTDGKTVVTVCQEKKEVFLWDAEEAKKIRAVTGPGQCTEAYFCMGDKALAYEKDQIVMVEDVQTGGNRLRIPRFKNAWCVAGKDNQYVVICKKKECIIHDVNNNGETVGTVALNSGEKGFGELSVIRGSTNYVAITDGDQYHISVLDLEKKAFLPQFRGFPKVQDEDGDWEEYEVEDMRFMPDESCLVYTTLFTSEVLFVDFTGKTLKSIPADKDRTYTALKMSPDGSYLFLANDNYLHIFDYPTLKEVDSIEHVKSVKKVMMVTPYDVITLCDDGNVRIWDRRRAKLQVNEKDTFLKHDFIRYSIPLDNLRYLLMYGKLKDNKTTDTLIVYDIFKETVVKEFNIKLKGEESSRRGNIFKGKSWNKIMLEMGRKLHQIDLDTMTVQMTTEGHVSRSYKNSHEQILFTANNEILCLSKGAMNLKLHNLSTGKVDKIIKAGQKKKMEFLVMNKGGTVAAARTEDEKILLFDIVNYKYMYTIDDTEKYNTPGYCMAFNSSGTVLMFTAGAKLKEAKLKQDIDQVVCWDVQNQKEICLMNDLAYEKMYLEKGMKEKVSMTAVSEIFILDDERVLLLSFDDILRIHEINTGKLLHRLEGHYSSPDVIMEESSPYILTHASMDEEGTLRLWDKQTYKCLASFTLERDVDKIAISPGGKIFTSIMSTGTTQVQNLVQWKIHQTNFDFNMNPDDDDYPEEFSSKVVGDDLELDRAETGPLKQDPDDVDSDPDVDSDDDDDEDDNDNNDNA